MRSRIPNVVRLRAASVSVAVAWALFLPNPIDSCSHKLVKATTGHSMPGPPVERFVSGGLGLLAPTQELAVLIVAYCHLTGGALDTGGRSEVARYWNEKPPYIPRQLQLPATSGSVAELVDPWNRALDSWIDRTGASAPGIYRSRAVPIRPSLTLRRQEGAWTFESQSLNCAADAFERAAQTLRDRVRTYGEGSREVSEWVRGQQIVFRNCGDSGPIPEPLDDSWPEALRLDREYQIAAAHFYRRDTDAALARFRAIAREPRSPWRSPARYLVARTLIRSGRGTEGGRELLDTLADPAFGELRGPASWLLVRAAWGQRFEAELDPQEVEIRRRALHWLASLILGQTVLPGAAQALDDLTRGSTWRGLSAKESVPELVALDRWLERMEYVGPSAKSNTLSPRTLAPALDLPASPLDIVALVSTAMSASPEAAGVAELLARIERVPRSNAAWPTLQYHAARLLVARRELDRARRILDAVVGELDRLEDISGSNAARDLRSRTARSLSQFLEDAEQAVAMYSFDGLGFRRCGDPDLGTGSFGCGAERILSDAAKRFLDARVAPASILTALEEGPTISEALASRLLLSSFARALLLDERETATRIATELVSRSVVPSTLFQDWRTERDPARQRALALMVLLRNPGLSPFAADSRLDFEHYDDLGRGWWCERDPLESPFEPLFFEREPTALERSPLESLPAAIGLGEWVLDFARRSPDDEVIPEALARVVRLTRHGCTSSRTPPGRIGSISKAAFDLLHQRYAGSAWARETPYWFE